MPRTCEACVLTPGLLGNELCPECNGTPDLDDPVHIPGEPATYIITSNPAAYTSTTAGPAQVVTGPIRRSSRATPSPADGDEGVPA